MFRQMEMQIVSPCLRDCLVIRAMGSQKLITRCQLGLWSLEFDIDDFSVTILVGRLPSLQGQNSGSLCVSD